MAEQELDSPSAAQSEDEARSGAHGKLTTLTPAEALARIQSGRPLENVRVEKLVFSGEFSNLVRLKNCHLIKPRFDGAVFKVEASFTNCTLDHPHFARETIFEGELSLRCSTLQAAQLSKMTVKGSFNASVMQARGQFALIGCRFEGPVSFWDESFHNWVNIKRTTFIRDADFRAIHAHKGVTFGDCRFEAAALFRGASVAMKFDLGNSHIEGLLDLSRAKLNDYAYLEGIAQGEKGRFAFENTVGERVLVRPEQIRGRLHSEETGNYTQAMQEYAYLKRAFAALHRYDEEDWAFYRFKVNQRRSRPRSWLRPWTKLSQFFDWLLLDVGCGYGANPMRAVRAALVIMLGFALVYMIWIDHFYIDPEKRPFPEQPLDSWANRIMVGTTVSVSVFTSGIGGIKELARDWMNVPLIIESLMGTLLWGLFIVSFSRKVIR
jgi:hypothetical protein